MKKSTGTILIVTAALLAAGGAFAAAGVGEPVSVGVFNFETTESGIENLGPKIADMVSAYLSADPNLRTVERAEIGRVLSELGLSMTGIVDEAEAVRVGRMIGAKILVTGRAFPIDGELVIVAKIIGTETTRVFGGVVKAPLTEKLTGLIDRIAVKITETIEEKKTELVPAPRPEEDTIARLRDALKDKTLPRVSVVIPEEHIGERAIDPAAATEIIFILRKCGFEVVRPDEEILSGWARSYLKDSSIDPPSLAEPVDILLIGEAFSEFAARTGSLISCKARAEISAVDASTGRVLAIGRKTETAVDLSEHIAAKTALKNAARQIAATLLPETVEKWER